MSTRMAQAGDVELWTQSFGAVDRPVLLLIAGDCQSAFTWPDEFVETLVDAGFRVLRYDHRDTGRSTHRDFAEHPYDFDDLAADAIAVLDGWDVTTAHVAGFGMGAALAQLLALDHARRLTTMTLIGAHALDVDFFGNWERAYTGEPTPDGLPTPRRWFLDMALNWNPPSEREARLDHAVEYCFALSGDQLPFDAAEFRRWEERALEHGGDELPGVVHPHGLITQSLTARGDELAGIRTPALVIQAPLDPISPPPHGKHLAEALQAARLVEITGMGHALPSAVHMPLAREIRTHALGG